MSEEQQENKKTLSQKAIAAITKWIVGNKIARNLASGQLDKILKKNIMEGGNPNFSEAVKTDRYNGMRAMYKSFFRNIDRGVISKDVAKKFISTLVEGAMMDGGNRKEAAAKYNEKYGINPPGFITISPTQKCNLKCTGCYASSDEVCDTTLDWKYVDQMLKEGHDELGMRFFVISGGEPFMYNSDGKTIMDIFRQYRDCFFQVYTNGTLITKEIAQELAELGNVTCAISVEGYKDETDERRGDGVYDRVLKAFANLKETKVPFGVSVTVTSKNVDLVMTDEFYDHYFDKMGVTYMWMFQYMPIGRKFTEELMIKPEQRLEMYKVWKRQMVEKERFIADFWNSAELCSGCLSMGKNYFYVDWNGNVMPCVFVPYYKDNIKDLYDNGKKMVDALWSDLFVKGREWQAQHLDKGNGKSGNLLMPCPMRDHHREIVKILKETGAKPEDEAAKQALESDEYHEKLYEFDDKLAAIEDPYWEEHLAKKD